MIIWALLVGVSLTVNGKLDASAQVEAVFRTEKECQEIKARLDKGSKEAVDKGEVNQTVNSFGAVCAPVHLNIHNKPAVKGA
jgi:hypothetical protein